MTLSLKDIRVWKDLQVSKKERLLIVESKNEAFWFKHDDSPKKAKFDGLSGQKIKSILGPYPAPLIKDLKEKAGESMPSGFDWTARTTFYILTESGKLYWYQKSQETEILE